MFLLDAQRVAPGLLERVSVLAAGTGGTHATHIRRPSTAPGSSTSTEDWNQLIANLSYVSPDQVQVVDDVTSAEW